MRYQQLGNYKGNCQKCKKPTLLYHYKDTLTQQTHAHCKTCIKKQKRIIK